MRRALRLLVAVGLLAFGLAGCTRKPVAVPCPAPAPKPEPAVDLALLRAEEEARRKAAEESHQKAEAPRPTTPPQAVTVPTPKAQPRVRRTPTPRVVTPTPLPGHDQIRYSAPNTMALGVPTLCTVDIAAPQTIATLPGPAGPYQIQNLQRASYYLIGLESEFPGNFAIEPNPGQDQKQHRASTGSAAHWQYRVTARKTGKHRLFYTLRVYQEGDSAGTVVRVEPVEVLVTLEWPRSYKAEALRMAREYGVWTALVGLVAVLLGAWLKPREKNN